MWGRPPAPLRERPKRAAKKMAALFSAVLAALAAAIFLQYLIPSLLLALFARDADLKRKYGAEWGLVTGASSGEFFSPQKKVFRRKQDGLPPARGRCPPHPHTHNSGARSPCTTRFRPLAAH